MTRKLAAHGFTLLEIILTFVLFGIVAVMGVSYFGVGMTRTDIAKNQLQTDASLQLVMENMIADQTNRFGNDLTGFNTALGTADYGSGTSYVITDKRFVCPSGATFVNNSSTNQFLLVTIQPSAASGVSLTYLFGALPSSANGSCNVAGTGS